jgi:hypothetical protein
MVGLNPDHLPGPALQSCSIRFFSENEPVVCKAEEALDCFFRTKMESLLLGTLIVSRRYSTA